MNIYNYNIIKKWPFIFNFEKEYCFNFEVIKNFFILVK